MLLIISAPAVCRSTRVFARLPAISGETMRCSADESRIGAAEDLVVLGVDEKFSLTLSD